MYKRQLFVWWHPSFSLCIYLSTYKHALSYFLSANADHWLPLVVFLLHSFYSISNVTLTWASMDISPGKMCIRDSLYGEERIGAEETLAMRTARPLTDKWTFSTNGVSIMGRNGIPCIGFGPGAEAQAHAPNEKTWKQDLVTCAAVYACLLYTSRCV